MKPVADIVRTIRQAKRILAVTHIHPDGDALGSLFAMGDILRALGKEVYLYCEDAVSHLYDFLPGGENLQTAVPDISEFDCGIALDCGDCFRIGQAREIILGIRPFIVIDHHASHKAFGDLCWIDPQRSSTGEMVYELAGALGVELSYAAAYCIYTAIVADTGSFRYSSTTPATMRIAEDLLARGVRPDEVAGNLFDNFTVNRLQLLCNVLATLELHAGGRIGIISLPQSLLVKTGAIESEAETFINYPRSLKTVNVAAFIKEKNDGVIGVSLRSKGDTVDVAAVAEVFGGGGHKNAAGYKVKGGTIDGVRQTLLKELESLIDRSV